MTSRTSTYLRRLALATMFAAAATFSASAFGDPAVACAEPRELDVGAYDNCTSRVDDAVIDGDISEENQFDAYRQCCEINGGVWPPTAFARLRPLSRPTRPRGNPHRPQCRNSARHCICRLRPGQ